MSSAISSRCSRLAIFALASACARSSADGLREVHDVHRRPVRLQQVVDRLVHRRGLVVVAERHRAFDAGDGCRVAVGAPGQVVGDLGRVAERGRHEHELRTGEQQQRHLPGPAAVLVGVEVELVHDDDVGLGVAAVPQCLVREDLGRAADDGRVGVHGRVAGHHADVLRPEDVDEGEELLAHQSLDRGRVEGAPARGHRREVGADRHERLPGARRSREDEVRSRDDLDERLLLGGVEAEAGVGHPALERLEDHVGIRRLRKAIEEGTRIGAHDDRSYGRGARGPGAAAPGVPHVTILSTTRCTEPG